MRRNNVRAHTVTTQPGVAAQVLAALDYASVYNEWRNASLARLVSRELGLDVDVPGQAAANSELQVSSLSITLAGTLMQALLLCASVRPCPQQALCSLTMA
jgi:hypothetical protein